MKILVANKYWREAGGVETHMFQVVTLLEAAGHTVIPFAMREPDTSKDINQDDLPSEVDFRATTMKEKFRAVERSTISHETIDKLKTLIKREKPDAAYVIHVYHQLGMKMLNLLHKMKVPVVLSLHDYKIACANYRLYSEKTGSICTKCLTAGRTAAVINPLREGCWGGTVSASAALVLDSFGTQLAQSYAKPEIVTVLNSLQREAAIHAGVRESAIRVLRHPVEIGAKDKSVSVGDRFLYVGRLVPEKGVDVLIGAVASRNLSLDIVGSGRELTNLTDLASTLGADVRFLGNCPHNEVADYMDRSVALVVPSTWHEVSPFVIYEAFGRRLPVVGSRVGGIPDLLGEGRGLLVEHGQIDELGDAMVRLLKDFALRDSIAGRAHQFAHLTLNYELWSKSILACLGDAIDISKRSRRAAAL